MSIHHDQKTLNQSLLFFYSPSLPFFQEFFKLCELLKSAKRGNFFAPLYKCSFPLSLYRVFIKYFFKEFYIFCDLLRKHSATIGCTKMVNKSYCTLGSLARMSCSSTCSELGKTQFFMNTLYVSSSYLQVVPFPLPDRRCV